MVFRIDITGPDKQRTEFIHSMSIEDFKESLMAIIPPNAPDLLSTGVVVVDGYLVRFPPNDNATVTVGLSNPDNLVPVFRRPLLDYSEMAGQLQEYLEMNNIYTKE